jgi:acyl-lipid omega-6 desaturase (Delta-12 desaturase)
LRWFTANIGIHHIHHLCSRIPYYRLPLVLRDHPDLDGIRRLTLFQSLRCVRLVLWDEGKKRLVSFREMRRHQEQDLSVLERKTRPLILPYAFRRRRAP